jgi:hypothetical protein
VDGASTTGAMIKLAAVHTDLKRVAKIIALHAFFDVKNLKGSYKIVVVTPNGVGEASIKESDYPSTQAYLEAIKKLRAEQQSEELKHSFGKDDKSLQVENR